MTYCELCELLLDHCPHGATAARNDRMASSRLVLVSPTGTAHFPGCYHKGDDPDFSQWGEIDGPGIWQRLGNGDKIPVTGGSNMRLVARGRCEHCIDHGPWE